MTSSQSGSHRWSNQWFSFLFDTDIIQKYLRKHPF